jgi:dethiobiotin synthetase
MIIGLSGPPGVGKTTVGAALMRRFAEANLPLVVLDPVRTSEEAAAVRRNGAIVVWLIRDGVDVPEDWPMHRSDADFVLRNDMPADMTATALLTAARNLLRSRE